MSRIDELIERLCPDGVEYRNLGEVTRIARGKRVVRKNLSECEGYPVYQNSLKPLGFYGEANRPGGTAFVICAGAAGDVGYSSEDFWSADDCFCPESNKEVNGRYLYHVLLSMQPRLKSQVRKASIPRLSPKAIENLCVPVPPMEVQQEIVRVLDSFAELEAELEAELKARRRQYAHYRDGLLGFAGRDDIRWMKLGEVLQEKGYIRGPFGSALRKSDMVSNGVPVYEQQHAIYGHRAFRYFISEDKAKSLARFKTSTNDLLMSCSGTVGETSIIRAGDKEGIINQALLLLRVKRDVIEVKYLEHYLHSSQGRMRILQKTAGSAQVNICNRKEFEAVLVPVPPLEEQERIVAVLDKFDALVNDISQGIPAEIEARRKQYEYYRDKLLSFKEKVAQHDRD